MIKNVSQLIHTVNGKLYQFNCDQDSPLEHIKEALFQFTKFIGQIEDNLKKSKEEHEKALEEQQNKPEEEKQPEQENNG